MKDILENVKNFFQNITDKKEKWSVAHNSLAFSFIVLISIAVISNHWLAIGLAIFSFLFFIISLFVLFVFSKSDKEGSLKNENREKATVRFYEFGESMIKHNCPGRLVDGNKSLELYGQEIKTDSSQDLLSQQGLSKDEFASGVTISSMSLPASENNNLNASPNSFSKEFKGLPIIDNSDLSDDSEG